MPKFAEKLRQERERLGLTKEQMAEAGGVKKASQYLYEKGDRTPNANYLLNVKQHGVDLNYLFEIDMVDPDNQMLRLHPKTATRIHVAVNRIEDANLRLLAYQHLCSVFSNEHRETGSNEVDNNLAKFLAMRDDDTAEVG